MESLAERALHVKFNLKTKFQLTALMMAARDKSLQSCLDEVRKGANPETTSRFGLSLLHFAALNSIHGLNITAYFSFLGFREKDEDGEEPIHYALRWGNYELANRLLLLRNDACKNLLHFCVMDNNLHYARKLAYKKLIPIVDENGLNALHYAAEFANRRMCKWLLEKDKSLIQGVTKDNSTPLHFACKNVENGGDLVAFFVSEGLDVDHENDMQKVPLHFALEATNIPAALRLFNLGASTKVRCGNFENLLHFCAARNLLESANLVHHLDGKLVHGVCLGGHTALHVAAVKRHFDFCTWLVSEAGADVNVQDNEGHTALRYVGNCAELGNFLIDAVQKVQKQRGTII